MAIQITGLANSNSLSPRILVRDNMITGTTNRLVGNSTTPPIFVDLSGDFAIGTLPAYPASGSTVMTSDGTPGSNPCTGGGPGAMAMFQADRWKCF